MGRKPSPIKRGIKGISIPAIMNPMLAKIPDLPERTIAFWLSLLPEKERVIVRMELAKKVGWKKE